MPQLLNDAHRQRVANPLPRRGPRDGELALMRSLLTGPRRVSSGPIGRCVKRGWCRALIVDPPREVHRDAHVLYALTDAGMSLLGV